MLFQVLQIMDMSIGTRSDLSKFYNQLIVNNKKISRIEKWPLECPFCIKN